MTEVRKKENLPSVAQQELFPLKGSSSFRDDIELMALPFFSISRHPRKEPIEHHYEVDGTKRYVRITGGEKGIATIWDNDILIYARTLIAQGLNRGDPVNNKVSFHIHDFLAATGRDDSGKNYNAFKEAVIRLQTTTVFTNIAAGDYIEDTGFGWLQAFRMRKIKRRDGSEIAGVCELTLCDWLFNAAVAQRHLAIEPDYFQIIGGLERKLWLIIRRHLGRQPYWYITLDKLHARCASRRQARQFRHDMKSVVRDQPFRDFHLEITNDPPLLRGSLKQGRNLFLVARPRQGFAAAPSVRITPERTLASA